MLPAARRIRRADEFRQVLRVGARAATPTLVVHLARSPEGSVMPEPARAGFVVGRAVGGSVARHRVVRRLRHLMAGRLAELPDGMSVVVRALPPAAVASSGVLDQDLARALARASRALGHSPGTQRAVTQ